MHTLRYLLATAIVLSVALPKLTTASCIAQTPAEQLEAADIVVQATISNVDIGATSTTVTADVETVTKGNVGDTVTFVTGSGSTVSTSVDLYFEEGDQFDLYLYYDADGQLTTNTCTGTAVYASLLDNAVGNANVADDTGAVPVLTNTAEVDDSLIKDSSYLYCVIAILAGIAALIVGLIMVVRSRKQR